LLEMGTDPHRFDGNALREAMGATAAAQGERPDLVAAAIQAALLLRGAREEA